MAFPFSLPLCPNIYWIPLSIPPLLVLPPPPVLLSCFPSIFYGNIPSFPPAFVFSFPSLLTPSFCIFHRLRIVGTSGRVLVAVVFSSRLMFTNPFSHPFLPNRLTPLRRGGCSHRPLLPLSVPASLLAWIPAVEAAFVRKPQQSRRLVVLLS